jgi:hypothetical protein
MTMTAPRPRSPQQPKQLDAGMFQAEISSFALRLAAEGKAAKTIRTYTGESLSARKRSRKRHVLPGHRPDHSLTRHILRAESEALLKRNSNVIQRNFRH